MLLIAKYSAMPGTAAAKRKTRRSRRRPPPGPAPSGGTGSSRWPANYIFVTRYFDSICFPPGPGPSCAL